MGTVAAELFLLGLCVQPVVLLYRPLAHVASNLVSTPRRAELEGETLWAWTITTATVLLRCLERRPLLFVLIQHVNGEGRKCLWTSLCGPQ